MLKPFRNSSWGWVVALCNLGLIYLLVNRERGNLSLSRLEAATYIGPPQAPASKDQTAQAPKPIPAEREEAEIERKFYGGKGDKKHLGGFTKFDFSGMSPPLWRLMMRNWTVKSVVDLGCGRGLSTLWFQTHGARVLCVEGSHDAVTSSVLPLDRIVEHDITRGPWWPSETFDLAWSVEFLEHIGRPYIPNYIPILQKAAYLVVTHSRWGGWHHVEVHKQDWWIRLFESYGFRYQEEMTKMMRAFVTANKEETCPPALPACPCQIEKAECKGDEPRRKYDGQHLWLNGLVFLNPAVASLPQHNHLFYEEGCSRGIDKPIKCKEGAGEGVGAPDELTAQYLPLPEAWNDDAEWNQKLFGSNN